jgi:uncharacterized iron-regulated membrane protein
MQPVAGPANSARPETETMRFSVLGPLLLVHRYLGVVVGVLMTLWCLSGFVMMYQGYPDLTGDERLAGLAPLDFGACCNIAELPFAEDARVPDSVRVEMLLGRPVLRVPGGPSGGAFDLTTGTRVPELSAEQVREVASLHGRLRGLGEPRGLALIESDQWTVQAARRNRPVYRVELDDAAGTQLYVSGATGEVIQDTNRRERVLSWLGAIPHWLYPAVLRRNGPLWAQIVIWTSVLGTFLAATGLYVGISRLRRRDGRLASPFRGWWYWHHISGLVFGLFALTWVFSGLLTMNPWGTLVSSGGREHVVAIKGTATWNDMMRFLESAATTLTDSRAVQISPAVFGDRFHAVALAAGGGRLRLDRAAQPAPLQVAEINDALRRLAVPVAESGLLETEDHYYYAHQSEAELPIYRAVLADAERTRLYVSPVTGDAMAVDATMRASRWIRFGLHDLDFAGLRVRPVWDIVVGLLLLGATLTCAIGTWLAWKRLRRDAGSVWRLFLRPRSIRTARP